MTALSSSGRARIAVGPIAVDVESDSDRIVRWAARYARPTDCTQTLSVRVRETLERFDGPSTPETHGPAHDMTVSFYGWRCQLDLPAGKAEAEISVAGDVEPRGYGRIQSLVRVLVDLCLLPNGLALHGAGLVRNGRSYAFVGRSGAGKTTLAREFLESERLGDDHIIATSDGGNWTLWSSPFSGREGVRAAGPPAPLRAIALLEQAESTTCERLSPGDAFGALLSSVLQPAVDHTRLERLMTVVDGLVHDVPVVRLRRALEDDGISAVEEALR